MMNFEQAQAAARQAKADIERLEALHKEASDKLAVDRKVFAAAEAHAVDTLHKLEGDIGEARRELQTALQRQADAPLEAPAPASAVDADAEAAKAFEAIGERLNAADQPSDNLGGYTGYA